MCMIIQNRKFFSLNFRFCTSFLTLFCLPENCVMIYYNLNRNQMMKFLACGQVSPDNLFSRESGKGIKLWEKTKKKWNFGSRN